MFHVPLAPHLQQSSGPRNPDYGVTEPLLREYHTELEQDRVIKAQAKAREQELHPYAEILPLSHTDEGTPSAYPVLPSAMSFSPKPSIPASPQPQSNGGPQPETTDQSPKTGTQKKKQQSDFPPQVNDPTIRFLKVEVKNTDSVVSLAVRYGVSEAELRQYNRGLYIWSHCDFVDHVWVPQKVTKGETTTPNGDAAAEVNRKYLIVKQFMLLTSADEAEAKFYLDECSWDVQRAVRNYEIDAAAVKNVQELRKLPSKSQPAPSPAAEPVDRRGSTSQEKPKGFFSRLLDKKESPKAESGVKKDPHTGSTTVKFSSTILKNRKN